MDHLLESLTPAQRTAVQHVDGALLILAGPGSGKTRVVTHRIAHLLASGIPARQILALTFTNKAADEMRSRVEQLAPGEPVWMSTFHRFCARLLRTYSELVGLSESFTIYDTADSRKALTRTLEDLDLETLHYTPDKLAAEISKLKNRLVTAATFEPRHGVPLDQIVAQVYPAYQARLLASSAVDFDDLLLHVAQLLRDNPEVRTTLDARYRYVMVDEYQDTNLVQYAIVRLLSVDYPNIAVTGDPDQSIYSWRGANISNILNFERDFPNATVVRLEQNYRSTKRILRVADTLIKHNVQRKDKELYTDNAEGNPVRLVHYSNQLDEAEGIAEQIVGEIRAGRRRPRDFAIFYRVNALSRTLESALRDAGIPYQMVNGLEFYQRKEIKDLVAYLQLINNPRDDVALARIINTPPRSIGRTTIDHLREHANSRRITLLEAAREAGLIGALAKRAAVQVAKFVSMHDRLRAVVTNPVEAILGHVLAETAFRDMFTNSEAEPDLERLANIDELLTAARQYDEQHPNDGSLEGFLEQASLVNDTDAFEVETDKATLMTMHAAKGLEFPVVFIVALEHGLLPHDRVGNDPSELEEERRLLFVGVTRAEDELHLSYVEEREFRGQRRRTIASSFLHELPLEELEKVTLRAHAYFSDEYSQDVPLPAIRRREPTPESAPAALGTGSALRTAAEMDDSPQSGTSETGVPAVSADDFYQGMAVIHPQYSLGKIVALSGVGARRMATVAFVTGGQRTFVIENSPLRPARRE